jgi:D-alanyl-lipoteichoic acid acyltransferase DltB (MBOAT superfamily)
VSFTSWQYPLFLLGVVLLYWRLPLRGRLTLLLAASYLFYGVWDVRFLALLLTSTCIDYYCGRAIVGERVPIKQVFAAAVLPLLWLGGCAAFTDKSGAVQAWIIGAAAAFPLLFTGLYMALWHKPEAAQRRAFLLLSILTNLAVLGFFKYFNFFAGSLLSLAGQAGFALGWTLPTIILPVAISFYTFQSIAYSVDIYRGKAQPARDLLTFGAYLSFFPQLVAGPIERPNDLLPQFTKAAEFAWEHIHRGLRLLLIGLFKKVFVADNCALLANHVFNGQAELNAPWAVLGVVAFAFQIYGDFSGYTDLARGSARVLGIHLNSNFRFPYAARGPSDFWTRWHITLSAWFRDYVYIPLGGNRAGTARTLGNLWIAMLLAGLWHGASWIFVLWGAYHAALLTLYRLVPWLRNLEAASHSPERAGDTSSPSPPPGERAGVRGQATCAMAVMFAFTLVGWAIFRAPNLAVLGNWFGAFAHWSPVADAWVKPACWLALHAVPLLLLQWATRHARDEVEIPDWPGPARGLAFVVLFLAIASSAVSEQEFIYFQF